jgi:hypothetical protein
MSTSLITETITLGVKCANVETDSSINRSETRTNQTMGKAQKKRIGPYSYKLNDILGYGFSSIVYRGCKDDDKRQVVALKVVKTAGMAKHRRNLL